MALLPFQRKSYSGFLRSQKINWPQPGLNPWTLGPVASMLTTGPPGSTISIFNSMSIVNWYHTGKSFGINFCTNWILYASIHNLLCRTLRIVEFEIATSLLARRTDFLGLHWEAHWIVSTSCSVIFFPCSNFSIRAPVSRRFVCQAVIVSLWGSFSGHCCLNLLCTFNRKLEFGKSIIALNFLLHCEHHFNYSYINNKLLNVANIIHRT